MAGYTAAFRTQITVRPMTPEGCPYGQLVRESSVQASRTICL